MGLKPRFALGDIRAMFADRMQRIDDAIIYNLSYLGELCMNQARSVQSYRDQTGNLRSSVGYVLLKNGAMIRSNFGTGPTEGSATGEALAKSLAAHYPSGYVLIIVAGMNYAAAVESRGLDVLSSAEHLAETELPRLVRELKLQIDQMS